MKCTQPVKTAASRLSALPSNASVHQREGYLCFVPRSRRIQRSFALGGAGSVVV